MNNLTSLISSFLKNAVLINDSLLKFHLAMKFWSSLKNRFILFLCTRITTWKHN